MTTAQMGYIGVALAWILLLIPIVRGLVRFIRTTRLADLRPRITRVPNCHGVVMVSGQRASVNPAEFVQVTPWCWMKRK